MTRTYVEEEEAMRELPKSEDLGTYVAEANRIKAELKLYTNIVHLGQISSGMDWYVADIKFFTDPIYREDKEGFSVSAHYSSNVLEEIFVKMKVAESGIEGLLKDGTLRSNNWRAKRNVMRCIFSLEDQTKHLYKEREAARRQRNLKVYGMEHPHVDND